MGITFLFIAALIVVLGFAFLARNESERKLARQSVLQEESSNLVKHAETELRLLGEEKDVIEWYLRVVQEYASFGHSGGSASATIPVLCDLLQYKNLTPLTDDPDEWFFHGEDAWGEVGGIWQNVRNSEALSKDGGKSYYLVSEFKDDLGQYPLHVSEKYRKDG